MAKLENFRNLLKILENLKNVILGICGKIVKIEKYRGYIWKNVVKICEKI